MFSFQALNQALTHDTSTSLRSCARCEVRVSSSMSLSLNVLCSVFDVLVNFSELLIHLIPDFLSSLVCYLYVSNYSSHDTLKAF